MHYSLVSPLGWDLMYLARLYGVEDYILFPSNNNSKVADNVINMLYQASDAYVNLSYAEGFGYPIVEAKLTGLPCILPTMSIHASSDDIMVDQSGPEFVAQGQSEVYKSYKIDEVVDAFERMYNDIQSKKIVRHKIAEDVKLILDDNQKLIEKWENVL
ncbi:MAG: hypothetical protein IPO06_13960 [Leptospiraceae bacterium]|nr:hypothetical protein [Leptospiraceae bacterium]